jgi:hypothetical protein
MQVTQDALAARQQEIAEQAAVGERAYRKNVELFLSMWLSLGSDVTKLDGTRHDAAIAEARGLAAWRWNQLLQMEQQALREEAAFAARPKTRPTQPGDEVLPDRTLEQRNADWQVETKDRREGVAALQTEAKAERKLLEAYIVKSKGR